MENVYVVVENGDPYNAVYTTYDIAVSAVKLKHKDAIDEELQWIEDNNGSSGCNMVDVPENKEGAMYLYIEKGIHIYIYRLPILSGLKLMQTLQ
jgi:hypothetical protein